MEPEDEMDLRDQKRSQNFGKQASLRELENIGVDRRILKHNRLFSFKQNVCLNDILHQQREMVLLNRSKHKPCWGITFLTRAAICLEVIPHYRFRV
jgi:hypothetical protein